MNLRDIVARPFAEARAILEALSHNELDDRIQAALQAAHPSRRLWVRDVYEDFVIFEDAGPRERGEGLGGDNWDGQTRLYRVGYSVGDDDAVTISGEPQQVVARMVYDPVSQAPATEAARDSQPDSQVTVTENFEDLIYVPLVEAAGKAGKMTVKVIQPGWGSSGYYPAEVLKRDGPKLFTAGTKMFWNHPTKADEAQRPERSLDELAGVLTRDAYWLDDGPAGPGLYAEAQVRDSYLKPVAELKDWMGVSIRAGGFAKQGVAEGREGRIVERLTTRRSLDFVTEPGAGGKVVELFEAARPSASAATRNTTQEASVDELKALQDRLDALEAENKALRADNEKLREAAMLREARDLAQAQVAQARLPEVTAKRLVESLARQAPTKDGALDVQAYASLCESMVAEARSEVEAILGEGRIRGMGSTFQESAPESDPVKVQESLADSFRVFGLSEDAAKIAAAGR